MKLGLLVFSHIMSSWLAPIPDCDEVFNYWEPLHYLVFGNGQETWEYSPEYGLRSYFYLLLHAFPTYLLKLLGVPSVYNFKLTRLSFGLFSTFAQHKLLDAIEASEFTYFLFSINSGLFMASQTFLPSTFAMNFMCLALCSFLNYYKKQSKKDLFLALLHCGVAMVVGWPFVAIIPGIFVLPYLYKHPSFVLNKDLWTYGILALVFTIVPSVVADSFFYGKVTFAVLNLIKYNTSLGSNLVGSSVLFGTDPWHMYLLNLFLNFNFVSST